MTLPASLVVALAGGLGIYFIISGIFEWVYYRRRRHDTEAWKCQPKRFTPPALRRQEIALGTGNLIGASLASGYLAYRITHDNPTRLYLGDADHGLVFGLAVTIAYFMVTDAGLYWAHRLYHRPALFRLIHRYHHRNTTPTAFTAMAMHPVEFATYQAIVLAPTFLVPLPVWGFVTLLIYQNLIALLDHSGVRLKSRLPWQPPPRFHDDHHKYFHVNYGQTLGLWDRVFGTWRCEGRRYGEEVFGGKGAPDGGAVKRIDYAQG